MPKAEIPRKAEPRAQFTARFPLTLEVKLRREAVRKNLSVNEMLIEILEDRYEKR